MPAKFSIFAVAATPIVSVALACGGDDDGGGIKVPDSGMGSGSQITPDAAATCFIDPSLTPTFGSNDQFAETNGSGFTGSAAHTELWGALLNADMPPDVVQVELYAGFGVFAGKDIEPGTYSLTGDELNYKTCGACVRIFADATQMSTAAQYFATGGSLTLTSTVGTLEGTLSNITLTKVTIAQDFTSTPVNDGCNTTITSATMNAPLTMGSAMAVGKLPIDQLVIRNRRY